MADTAASAVSGLSSAATPKMKDSGKAKKLRSKPSHPKTSDMVTSAIKNLKERGGSSLQAIQKYISSNYKVDAEELAPFIKKYLKSAVTSASLVQTKGKGASGSFKLAGGEKVSSGEKKASRPTSATKPASGKKATAAGGAAKKSAKPKAAKSPFKAKVPTKKPRAPKPKKADKGKSPKKAVPKKK